MKARFSLLVQPRRDKAAAVKLMRKLLKKQGFVPDLMVTDKLRSYSAAKAEMGLSTRHEQGLRNNNRAENSASADATARAQDDIRLHMRERQQSNLMPEFDQRPPQ